MQRGEPQWNAIFDNARAGPIAAVKGGAMHGWMVVPFPSY